MASTITRDMQEQVLSTLRKGQEVALDALRSWVETVQSVTPSLPAMSIPFADRLPDPHEVVDSSYKFAEKILASQKKFATEVLEVAGPLLPGEGKPGEGKSAK